MPEEVKSLKTLQERIEGLNEMAIELMEGHKGAGITFNQRNFVSAACMLARHWLREAKKVSTRESPTVNIPRRKRPGNTSAKPENVQPEPSNRADNAG